VAFWLDTGIIKWYTQLKSMHAKEVKMKFLIFTTTPSARSGQELSAVMLELARR
jgi:hypothetical protein